MQQSWRTATIRRTPFTCLPTRWGIFRMAGFERPASGGRGLETAVALIMGDPMRNAPLVRIHSQCFTGDVLGSRRCDCGDQLELAMQSIAGEERGLLIYEQQEGRGIGLMAKIEAYSLQDEGLDTIAANHALGFATDCRDFSFPAAILTDLGVSRVRLLSNNPDKMAALVRAGIDVVEQVACEAVPSAHALAYMRTKKERMGHVLTLL